MARKPASDFTFQFSTWECPKRTITSVPPPDTGCPATCLESGKARNSANTSAVQLVRVMFGPGFCSKHASNQTQISKSLELLRLGAPRHAIRHRLTSTKKAAHTPAL